MANLLQSKRANRLLPILGNLYDVFTSESPANLTHNPDPASNLASRLLPPLSGDYPTQPFTNESSIAPAPDVARPVPPIDLTVAPVQIEREPYPVATRLLPPLSSAVSSVMPNSYDTPTAPNEESEPSSIAARLLPLLTGEQQAQVAEVAAQAQKLPPLGEQSVAPDPTRLPPLSPDPTTSEQVGEISRQYDGRPSVPTAERLLPPLGAMAPTSDMTNLPPLRPSQISAEEAARIEGKKYGFQKDEQGNIRRDASGKPLYEKDRDSDHNWWDVVKSAGLGLAKGGLPGAIGGAIGGAIDRNFDEKAIDEIKLGRLNSRFENQTQREQAAQGYETRETQRKNIEQDNVRADGTLKSRERLAERNTALRQLGIMKRYKRGENPEFDAKIESLGVEQPDFEPGKKVKPRYWDNKTGKLMTFDDNNATIPVITPGGAEIVNDSRKEVESGGYTVMPGAARSADAQVESSRVGAANKTSENQYDYQTTVTKTNSEIAGVRNRIARLQSSIAPLQAKLDAQTITKEEYDQLNSKTKELGDAQDKQVELQDYISKLPKPSPTAAVTGNNVGTYSEAQFRQIFKDKTPQELKFLVENARAQGIIK